MAPPNSRSSKRTARKASKPRRTEHKKKKLVIKSKRKNIQKTAVSSSVLEDLPSNTSTISSDNVSKIDDDENNMISAAASSNSPCSTPKAQRFRIPKIETCPPAPKKQRVDLSNCSLHRTPIAFFAPPDLELFFFFALRDISV